MSLETKIAMRRSDVINFSKNFIVLTVVTNAMANFFMETGSFGNNFVEILERIQPNINIKLQSLNNGCGWSFCF